MPGTCSIPSASSRRPADGPAGRPLPTACGTASAGGWGRTPATPGGWASSGRRTPVGQVGIRPARPGRRSWATGSGPGGRSVPPALPHRARRTPPTVGGRRRPTAGVAGLGIRSIAPPAAGGGWPVRGGRKVRIKLTVPVGHAPLMLQDQEGVGVEVLQPSHQSTVVKATLDGIGDGGAVPGLAHPVQVGETRIGNARPGRGHRGAGGCPGPPAAGGRVPRGRTGSRASTRRSPSPPCGGTSRGRPRCRSDSWTGPRSGRRSGAPCGCRDGW